MRYIVLIIYILLTIYSFAGKKDSNQIALLGWIIISTSILVIVFFILCINYW